MSDMDPAAPAAEPAAFALRPAEPSLEPAPDALALLRRDHIAAARLIEEYDRAVEAVDKVAIAERLCMALTVHARIEEELFYPTLRRAGAAGPPLDDALVEHRWLHRLILEVEAADLDDPLHDAKVRVLGHYALHHAGEEERTLFERARSLDIDLAALGATIMARKAVLDREAALNLKTRLRAAGGPAMQLEAQHADGSAGPAATPLGAAAAAAELALTALPGGGRLRRMLHPEKHSPAHGGEPPRPF
jgi:hypothetical protein